MSVEPTQLIFVTLCYKPHSQRSKNPKPRLSVSQQIELSHQPAIDAASHFGKITNLVWEVTQDDNVHWHMLVITRYTTSMFLSLIQFIIKKQFSKILHSPEYDSVKFAYDPQYLKRTYFTKASHNRDIDHTFLEPNEVEVPEIIVSPYPGYTLFE